jgi:FG-GAP-like repeat/Bacterial Ig domain
MAILRMCALVAFLMAVSVVASAATSWFSNQSALYTQLSSQATAIAAADLDGSGHLSIVTLNASSGSVGVLLGNGDGTFKPESTYTVASGGTLEGLALGDINGDGKIDIVVGVQDTSTQPAQVALLFGNGDGTFQAAKLTALPQANVPIQDVAIGDINGDGYSDVVTTDGSDVFVWYGDGTGAISPALGFGNTNNLSYQYVTVAPFGGAQGEDIVAGEVATNNGSVVLGYTGSTNLSVLSYISNAYSVLLPTSWTFAGSINPDLVFLQPAAASILPGSLSFMTDNGNGSFQTATGFIPGNNNLYAYALGDLSGSAGEVDAEECSRNIFILNGNTVITDFLTTDINGNIAQYGDTCVQGKTMISSDFNGDGYADLAYLTQDSTELGVMLNNAKPGVNYFEGHSAIGGANVITTTQYVDVNHDGNLDAVSEDPVDKEMWVSFGDGKGGFMQAVSYPLADTPGIFAIGDARGTGYPDIFVMLPNGYYEILINNGNGSFTVQPKELFQYPQAAYVSSMAFVDVANAGKPDLLYGDNQDSKIYVLPNTGNDTFGTAIGYSIGPSGSPSNAYPEATKIIAVDASGNGYPDLVVVTTLDFSILLNNGNGTFGQPTGYDWNSVGPQGIAFGDINGDGIPDIATSYNDANGVIVIWQNNGNGTFTQSQTISFNYTLGSGLAIADLDGTGINDILAVGDNSLVELQNNGLGQFATPLLISSPQVNTLSVGDFNNDGHPDFAVSDGQFTNDVNIYLTTTAKSPSLIGLLASGNPSQPVANNGTLTDTKNTMASGTLTGSPAISGDQITFSVLNNGYSSNSGKVVVTNTAAGTYTYTPFSNFTGTDSFQFTVTDNGTGQVSAPATITITVNSSSSGTGGGSSGGGGGGMANVGLLMLSLLLCMQKRKRLAR